MSLRSVEGHDLRELRPFGNYHLPIRSDVCGVHALIDGKGGMRTESPGSLTADAHGEVRALLDVLRPRIGVHRQPLGRDGVEDEEEHADRGEDGEEAYRLPFHLSTAYVFQAAFDERPAPVVREEAERAEPGLDTAPEYSFVDRVLVVGAGKERERPDGAGIREEAHRHEKEPLHHDVEEEGVDHENAEQSGDA